VLLQRWDSLVGDTLARLLASVLLEQKVLLLGDVARISTVALALRSLLWPFRWLHLFLSAPPPADLLEMPLLEGTFPMILALNELPPQWGYKTSYELPPEVVTGVLKHDYVHISPQFETSTGLKGQSVKLPDGRHTAFVKQVAQARHRRRKGGIDQERLVEVVQEAAEAEVWRLAEFVRHFAAARVQEGRAAEAAAAAAGPGEAAPAEQRARGQGSWEAPQPQEFLDWLRRERPGSCGSEEAASFYGSFFETQLCLDLLHEEILAQTAAEPNLSSGVKDQQKV